jgi:hypothetical protein
VVDACRRAKAEVIQVRFLAGILENGMPFKDIEAKRAFQRLWARQQRHNNPEYKKKRRKLNQAHARRWAAWFLTIKQGLSCVRCGENHPACIDFHHRDAETKLFEIGHAVRSQMSKAKILAEIEKCDALCANCHRKVHWEEKYGSAKEVV